MQEQLEREEPCVSDFAQTDADFRDRVIYFVVLDRFENGNESNRGLRSELNDPQHEAWDKYWGGDLQGLYNRLSYLRNLGISAIWVTPLFEQIESSVIENDRFRAPIHGYWTRDFKRINARWVNEENEVRLFQRNDTIFDRLLAEMHSHDMKFVLDFVCNHSSPAATEGKGRLYNDGELVADYENDQRHWYHHYGAVTDWTDEWQTQNCEVAGLATFNENNIEFRRYIKEAAKAWVSKSVDALRIDTVKHMPLWFWQEFNADLQLHRPDLFIFGEWIDSSPFDERSVACANTAGMSIIDFGFCHAARAALAEGNERGFELLGEVLAEDHRYRNASELVTCIESHDMPRFQSLNASPELLHLAYVLLLTSRGVPVLLYGTEQYLHNDTAGGHDPYNRPMMERWEETEAVRIVRTLARERRRNPAVQMGGQWTLWLDADTYVFERRYRDSQCVVFLNRAAEARQIPVHGLAMRDGDYECLLSGERYSVASGSLTVAIPALAARVLSYCGANVVGLTVVKFQMNGAPTEPGDRLAIIGSCPELGEWDLQRAYFLECVNAGTWFGEVAMESSIGKNIAYKYAIFPGSGDAQTLREPRVARRRMVSEAKTLKWRDVWAS